MSSLLPVHQEISGTPQTKGFQSFFHKLPEKPPAMVRIFDRGDFYTVHGSDAAFVAQRVFKTTSVVKQFDEGSEKLEYTTLSKLNFESLLRDLLLVLRYRVQVYKCNSSSSKNSQDWSVQFQGSPGNLTQFEDILFGSSSGQDSGGVLAVRLVSQNDGKLVGAAVVDATLQQITLAEFADGDQLGNLEALLVQLGPRECLLCPSDADADAVRQVMVRNNVLVTEVKRSDFSSGDMTSDLTRLLRPGRQSDLQEATDRRHAMQALSAAVRYLRLLESGSEHLGQFGWTDFHLERYVRLDGAAVRALNLLPTAATDTSAVTHSLLGLLNRCRTAQGSRLLAQWLKQPLRDVQQIEERLDLVEVFTEDAELRLALLEDHLRRVPDLQRLCKRLQRRRASLQDCYKVYRAVLQLDSLISLLQNSSSRHASVLDVNFVQPLKQCVQDFQKFMQMVESTVDLDSADKGTFVVKAEFDEDLQELRKKMTELEDSLDELLDRAAAELGLEARKTVKLESTPQMGYFFRITRKEEMILRDHKNYRPLETNKSGIKFRSESLLCVNDEFQQTSRAYMEQQKAVVDEIVAIAAGYLEPMCLLNETLARLDALVGMATAGLSAPTPYVRPRLLSADSEQPTELRQLRHACVEVQDGVSFIPNDVRFQHGHSTFKVITGPNMAGKSTYIRSVAVAVIMAQIGCFVPCESAVVRPVDAVMARVGAGDCQMKGVSTFMAEMLETSSILRSASRDSLLVIDELGRGTSTYDGFGLAWAISQHIVREIGAFTLFATHFHELTALATQLPEVENLHVTALVHVPTSDATAPASNGGRLTFLYRVAAGVCDQSFGIHVAEMVHFPDQVLADARRRAAQLEDFYGSDGFGTADSEEAPPSKRTCLDQEAGQELIQTFLSDYDALKGRDEDVQRQVELLMDRLRQLNHPYVSHLLQRFKLA